MIGCRFAQISDLHLGGAGTGNWPNRTLLDHAAVLTGEVIAALNAAPDFVVVTGDLTEHGDARGFALARALLDRLRMPYYVVPGNHDVLPPDARDHFRAAFVGRLSGERLFGAWEAGGVRCVGLDPWWHHPDDGEREAWSTGHHAAALPTEQLRWLAAELRAHPRQPTLVFLHYPLVPIAARFRVHRPQDAGHLQNGAAVLSLLGGHPQVRAVFCGHQHFHQITREPTAGGGLLHCQLGAMVEYPLAWREVTVDARWLTIATRPAPAGELRARSLAGAPWVCGDEEDRAARIETARA